MPAARLVLLPRTYRHDLGADFMNLVTAWDLLEMVRVTRGQWLAVTGGHSTVAILLTQFASALGVKVLSIVRKRRPTTDLQALGAQAVLALNETSDLHEAALEISGGGLHGIVDCVGGPDFVALTRGLRRSRAVIYGGFSPEPFSLHNLDILLNGLEIRSYLYRYFFNPPPPEEEGRVRQILALSEHFDLRIPEAGRYRLDALEQAFPEPASSADSGRRYFTPNG